MADSWSIRKSSLTNEEVVSMYDGYPNMFSVEIHHGGSLTKPPDRKYIGGTVDFVDLIDIDRFSIHEMDLMVNEIGYGATELIFYHFLNPNKDLDDGLEDLGCDRDVLNLGRFVTEHKIIKVYTIHGAKNITEFYLSPTKPKPKLTIEEIDEQNPLAIVPVSLKMLSSSKPIYPVGESSSTEPIVEADSHANPENQSNPLTEPNVVPEPIIEPEPIVTPEPAVLVSEPIPLPEPIIVPEPNVTPEPAVLVSEPIPLPEPIIVPEPNVTPNAPCSPTDEELFNFDFATDHGNTDRESFDNDMEFEAEANVGEVNRVDGESIQVDFNEVEHDTTSENGSSDDEDDDFIVDEDNIMDDHEVYMEDYHAFVDTEVEENVVDDLDEELEQLNNEELLSASESDDNDMKSKKHVLHKLRREKPEGNLLYVGQEFGSKTEAKEVIKRLSVETRRKLKFVKDDKQRLRVVCEGDLPDFEVDDCGVHVQSQKAKNQSSKSDLGKGKSKVGPVNVGGRGKKTNPHIIQCPYLIYISKIRDSESWVVKNLNNDHKCLPSRVVKACTSKFLSKQMLDQMAENPNIPVTAVQEQFQRKYELGVSKLKAYRARARAKKEVEGDYRAQYALLWNYANELRDKNPGTTVRIDVEPAHNPGVAERQFRRIYVCFGALKDGFKALGRKLLGLDGAFMKGPFPGQILSAVSVDNNNGIYPLCFAVVEAESLASWTWFLKNLGEDLELETNSDFTFISDRQKGLLPALAKSFPKAEHRFCLRHIHENMKLSFRGKLYKDLLWKAATATTVPECKSAMELIKKQNNEAFLWLSNIPAIHWSRSHFTGKAVTDVLLNNMCEVFNGKIVEGRDKPIISALEYIREYLMRRIVTVMRVQEKHDGLLTPYATTMLEKIKKDATHYHVVWNGADLYQVSGRPNHHKVVDLGKRTCSCRKWELTGLPCCHAVASIWVMATNGGRVGALESWANPIWTMERWKQVYSHKLNPINDNTMWVETNVPNVLTPPKHYTPAGRPKKMRKRSALEVDEIKTSGRLSKKNMQGTCGKCGGRGHNKRTCRGQGQEGQGGAGSTVQGGEGSSGHGGAGSARPQGDGSGRRTRGAGSGGRI